MSLLPKSYRFLNFSLFDYKVNILISGSLNWLRYKKIKACHKCTMVLACTGSQHCHIVTLPTITTTVTSILISDSASEF